MVQISLSDQDAAILRELLEAKPIDLQPDIFHTDSHQFRDTLHQLQHTLERVVAQQPFSATT